MNPYEPFGRSFRLYGMPHLPRRKTCSGITTNNGALVLRDHKGHPLKFVYMDGDNVVRIDSAISDQSVALSLDDLAAINALVGNQDAAPQPDPKDGETC